MWPCSKVSCVSNSLQFWNFCCKCVLFHLPFPRSQESVVFLMCKNIFAAVHTNLHLAETWKTFWSFIWWPCWSLLLLSLRMCSRYNRVSIRVVYIFVDWSGADCRAHTKSVYSCVNHCSIAPVCSMSSLPWEGWAQSHSVFLLLSSSIQIKSSPRLFVFMLHFKLQDPRMSWKEFLTPFFLC